MESMDLSQEQKPKRRKTLFQKGWRKFLITACTDEVISKSGNKQYILTIQDTETKQEGDLYAVSEPKKRWRLKEIMDACGLECKEGVYTYEPPLSKSLVGKTIMGFVEHEDNEWIARDGNKMITTQHNIVEITTVGLENIKPLDISGLEPIKNVEVEWDKDL